MKKQLTTAAKQLSWFPLGLERATKKAIWWAKEPNDQAQSRRRALTLFAVPPGVIVVGMDYPVPAITGSFAVLVGLAAWFGYTEERSMTVTEQDALPPYEVDGKTMTGREVMEVFLAAHAGESAEQMAAHLGTDVAEMRRQTAAWGLEMPPLSSPSPTETPAADPEVKAPDHGSAEGEEKEEEASPEGAVVITPDRGAIDSPDESEREEGDPEPDQSRLVSQQ